MPNEHLINIDIVLHFHKIHLQDANIFLIHQNITAIMLIPVILVLTLIASVFVVSRRENLEELGRKNQFEIRKNEIY